MIEQFWPKVDTSGECWIWIAYCDRKGYGWVQKWEGKTRLAHRVAYELSVGPIPDGLVIDHLCRNTSCCNPAHLEAVTPQENRRRQAAAVTHCKRGHPFDEKNTRLRNGKRWCRACDAMRTRQYKQAAK